MGMRSRVSRPKNRTGAGVEGEKVEREKRELQMFDEARKMPCAGQVIAAVTVLRRLRAQQERELFS
jgi:hypothetical protein